MNDRPKPTYWAELKTWLPHHYKVRTRLNYLYVLQLSGGKNNRKHKAALYCVMLTGRLHKVWTGRIVLSDEFSWRAVKTSALEALQRKLKDEILMYGRPLEDQNRLEASVQDFLDELRAEKATAQTGDT